MHTGAEQYGAQKWPQSLPHPSRPVWFQVKLDPSHLTFGAWFGAGWAERGKGTAAREGPKQGRLPSDKGRNSIEAY